MRRSVKQRKTFKGGGGDDHTRMVVSIGFWPRCDWFFRPFLKEVATQSDVGQL